MRDRERDGTGFGVAAGAGVAHAAEVAGRGAVRHEAAEQLLEQGRERRALIDGQRRQHRVKRLGPNRLEPIRVRVPGGREPDDDGPGILTSPPFDKPGAGQPVDQAHGARVREIQHPRQAVDRGALQPGMESQQRRVAGGDPTAIGDGDGERSEDVRLPLACMTHTCILRVMPGEHELEGSAEARERVRQQVSAAYEQGNEPPTRTCPTCHADAATWRSRCPECDKRYDRRWPWLTDRARWALAGVAVILVGAAVAYVAPRVAQSTREQAAANRAQQNARIASLTARMVREQKPQFANSDAREDRDADAPDRLAARRAVVDDLEAAILTDARRRIAAGRLDGPVKEVLCEPLLRTPTTVRDEDLLSKRRGRYDCVAVKRDVVRDGKIVARFGHPFVATADFAKGTIVWCKDNKVPGEAGKPLAKVRLDPRCLGAEGARPLGDGYVTPTD